MSQVHRATVDGRNPVPPEMDETDKTQYHINWLAGFLNHQQNMSFCVFFSFVISVFVDSFFCLRPLQRFVLHFRRLPLAWQLGLKDCASPDLTAFSFRNALNSPRSPSFVWVCISSSEFGETAPKKSHQFVFFL